MIPWAQIRGVAFDAVGTVIVPNPSAPDVYAEAARAFGLEADTAAILARFLDAFRAEESRDRDSGWATSEDREEARWRTIVAASLPGSPPACFDRLYEHFAQPEAWAVPPDVPPLLEELAGCGAVLALASNYDRRLNAVVAGRPELAPLAGRVVVSSQVGVRKPHPAFFARVAEAMGLKAEEILFVGDDWENDYQGATAAGMPGALIDPKGRHAGVPGRVASLAELRAKLSSEARG